MVDDVIPLNFPFRDHDPKPDGVQKRGPTWARAPDAGRFRPARVDQTECMAGRSIGRRRTPVETVASLGEGGVHAHLFTLPTCLFGKHGLPRSPSFRGLGPGPDGRTSFRRCASAATDWRRNDQDSASGLIRAKRCPPHPDHRGLLIVLGCPAEPP